MGYLPGAAGEGTELAVAERGKTYGSRRKTKYVRDKLEAQGFTKEQLDSVHAPIGIEIGSETPAEIAISIAAQLIQIRSAKTGKRKGAHLALHM